MDKHHIPALGTDEQLYTSRSPWPGGGYRWDVEGRLGAITFHSRTGRLTVVDPNGFEVAELDASWAAQVAAAVDAGNEAAVFELLAGHYRTELAKAGSR
ncbi:hypothetical protein [Micromonospora sp. C41]|uniref:hypothetical protein n=1 Tax=Micromonospora sp. C41 TaxID=2824878 RepID=UPI001B393829|nr:hypothetical protein [Micromonospora sp. C41]MBQ1064518.1 hypothetical protein [Micromonospora sp. C41]